MGAGREAGWRKARLTSELARFLAVSCWEDIPATIRREGKRAILNIGGCIVAGRGTTRFVASPETTSEAALPTNGLRAGTSGRSE